MAANNYELTSAQRGNLNQIDVTDVSTYDDIPVELLSAALFYSNDNFALDSLHDFSAPEGFSCKGPWILSSLVASATYSIRGFWCYKYDNLSQVIVTEGDIVFWNNSFYVKYTAGFGTMEELSPPANTWDGDFQRLEVGIDQLSFATLVSWDLASPTEQDIYELFLKSANLGGSKTYTAITFTTLRMTQFNLTKLSCYNYLLEKTGSKRWAVNVYAFEDFISGNAATISNADVPLAGLTFTVPEGNNVWIIKACIEEDANEDQGLPPAHLTCYYLVIYEFCTLEECFQKLIQDLLCNETVCNPETECNPKDLMTAEGLKRNDIMKISVLYFEFMMLIHAETMKYLNKYTVTDDREDRWQRASDSLKRIDAILLHCGICGSGAVGQSGCECENC